MKSSYLRNWGQLWMFFRSFVFHLVKEDHLNCGTQNVATAPAASAGNLLERQFFEPSAGLLNQKFWAWGAICVWISLPGDSDALWSLRTRTNLPKGKTLERHENGGYNIIPLQGLDSWKIRVDVKNKRWVLFAMTNIIQVFQIPHYITNNVLWWNN